MQPAHRSLVAAMVSLIVLSGCAAKRDSAQNKDSGTQASGLQPVNPAYPGPYKNIDVEGSEMIEARGTPGKFGGVLVRSIIGSDPKTFNYWTANDTSSSDLASLMFSGLVGVDAYNGDLYPFLAAEYTIDPDGVTYTTRLRKGLKWSDGKPVSADDVAYTWNTIIAGGYGNSSLRDITTIDGKSPQVTVVDELTNRFVTPKPFAPFARLLGLAIAPRHVIEPILKGKDGRKKFQELWSASNIDPATLVTCGPFVLERFVPSQRVEFVRTRNFFMVDKNGNRLPYLDKITYQIVPDVMTNLMKFKAGEIDMTQVRNRDVVELADHASEGNFKLYNLGQDIGTTFIMLNMNRRVNPETKKPYVDPVKSKWFNDVNFRQAVNHALNRENMVANYFKGIGFPLFTSEPPSSPYFNKELKGFEASPEYALSLLKKSGFDRRDDGALYDRDGHRVEFDLIGASGGTFIEAVGNMIVDDLKKLGIKANLQLINFNILGDKVSNSLDWDACIFALSPGDPLEPNDGSNVYKDNGRLHLFDQRLPDKSGNVTVTDARPWETRLSEIFNTGAETLDKENRRKLYNEYQQIIYDQAPFIYLVSPMVMVGARNTIGNYSPTQLSQRGVGLQNLEEIYKTK